MPTTAAQLARARKALEPEEAKREQGRKTDAEKAARAKSKQAVAERVALCAEMLASGHAQKQIALYLFVDERTVRNYIERIRKEMDYKKEVEEIGATRTKIAVAHGHDVRDAEDTTLAGNPRLGLDGAFWNLDQERKKH